MAGANKPYRYERPFAGVYGQISQVGERLVCHLCGRDFLNLGNHTALGHGLSARDYKSEFGLLESTPLWADSMVRAMREIALRSNSASRCLSFSQQDPGRTHAIQRAGSAARVANLARPQAVERRRQQAATRRGVVPMKAIAASAASRRAMTTCRLGHEFTLPPGSGRYRCDTCQREAYRRYREKQGVQRTYTVKLTEEAVREIRRLSAQGMSAAHLGRAYGVSSSTVRLILKGRTWRHVV